MWIGDGWAGSAAALPKSPITVDLGDNDDCADERQISVPDNGFPVP